MDLGFEICGENAYRIFYQALQKLKEQFNPSVTRLFSGENQDVVSQERLSVIIREQLGDVNLVLLVFVLVLLSAANQDTLVVYQQAYNDGQGPVETRPNRREEELEKQVMEVQKRLVKLQKENEQVWVTRVVVFF